MRARATGAGAERALWLLADEAKLESGGSELAPLRLATPATMICSNAKRCLGWVLVRADNVT